VQMLEGYDVILKTHKCLSYFAKDKTPPLALTGIEEMAKTLLSSLKIKAGKGKTALDMLVWEAKHEENLYAAVKALSDKKLEALHLFLSVICFGQVNPNRLDADENSLFNLVAKDLGVDMRNFWTPDEAFLSRRNKQQLEAILEASGAKTRFANLLQGKKADLVKKLAKYFQSLLTKKSLSDEEKQTRNWLPEAMLFPAVDPDAAVLEADGEEEDEEALSDEEELME